MYKKITPNPLTLKSLIDYSTTHFSGNTAVSFVEGNATMKYAELGAKINEMAGLLYSFGLQPGDNVALYCQNMPNWVVAYFAVVARGLVIVPILPDFTRAEVENVLLHSESKVLFVSDRLKSKTDGLELPDLKAKILVDDFSIIQGEITAAKPENLNDIEVKEEDIAAIIYTSGTTGRSKGVVLTQKNITFVAMQSYTVFPINEHDIFLSFLPLSHTYENSIGMLYPLMYGASIYYLEKPPTAASLIPAMGKIKPTMMLSVPLIMEKLYKSQIQAKFAKSKFTRMIYKTSLFRVLIHRIAGKKLYQTFGGRLKFFGIGGAKLDSRVERFLKEARFPYAIGYGLTETAPLLAGAAPHQTKLQSTGYAMEGVELKINEPDKKGVGEIWAKGPNVMVGYYKNPEATEEVLTADGWFRTGDFGKFDSKKRLFIRGRMKNTIVGASGENIYPEDIESVINNTQYVVESLVVEEDGYLVAKVILDLEAIEKNLSHLKSVFEEKKEKYVEWIQHFTKELNAKLNRASQINRVDIMDEPFEKTASQKIKRFLYNKANQKKK
ncbi:MAG: long-chain fatty acid--CoA ligase [Bacteroidia bacterium]|nr:long-chain fatty acid--CoA ligase [Bacteroidia bacterium]